MADVESGRCAGSRCSIFKEPSVLVASALFCIAGGCVFGGFYALIAMTPPEEYGNTPSTATKITEAGLFLGAAICIYLAVRITQSYSSSQRRSAGIFGQGGGTAESRLPLLAEDALQGGGTFEIHNTAV